MVCLNIPADLSAVGEFFDDFNQVSDEDVIEVLHESEMNVSALG
jgi:predicted phosphoribosyltransferase